MPLRDHFRPPLDNMRHWESLHGGWPMMIVAGLRRKLPRRYFAEVRVHSGRSAEIDVATFEDESEGVATAGNGNDSGGGVATAVWAPPRPTLAVAADLPAQDIYEVQVYDEKRRSRLVAAVEIVSPANKDRPDSRQLFVAKCFNLLRRDVCLSIIDLVTTRQFNLYVELLALLQRSDPAFDPPPPLYAVTCRTRHVGRGTKLDTWARPLVVGQPLPSLPVWLSETLTVTLELEASYEGTCRVLRIP